VDTGALENGEAITYVIKHPTSQISYVEVTSGGTKEVLRKINQALSYWEEAQDCISANDGYIDASISYAKNKFLSVLATEDIWCTGGAHGYVGNSGLNFDMTTGNQVKFSNLFMDYPRDEKAINKAVIAIAQKENPNPGDPDCSYDEFLGNNGFYPEYVISEKGIVLVYLGFPYAARLCEPDEVLIPLSSLSKYLKPAIILP